MIDQPTSQSANANGVHSTRRSLSTGVFAIYIASFFVVWSLRATVFIHIDESIHPEVSRSVYSTSIKFIASNATSSSIAATAATGSPMKRTLSMHSAVSSWLTGRMP